MKKNKIIFILGAARSGKSSHAVALAKKERKTTAFIATCEPSDEEILERVKKHVKRRPKSWKTIEESRDPGPVVKRIGKRYGVIIVDCLTLLISNLLFSDETDRRIERIVKNLLVSARRVPSTIIIVSNEVGMGIVPGNRLGRRFRDLAGRVNQIVGEKADEVIFMVAGIPLKLK